MAIQPSIVSVTVPVGQAIDRVKRLLFWPFDFSKWCTIGFCAWLASLGSGGGGFRGNFGNPFPGNQSGSGDFRHEFAQARAFVDENLYWIVPAVIALIGFLMALGVLVSWVKSRGQFMFLHCVALNKAEIGVPWRKFAREGNSLFRFRLVVFLGSCVVIVPLVIFMVVMIFSMIQAGRPSIPMILVMIGMGLVLMGVAFVMSTIHLALEDFVVPIMYLRGSKCREAWREFGALLSANTVNFLLYWLFQFVLAMGIGLITIMAVLVTCCCAGCVMAIPYVGTVLVLPLLIFRRAYSIHYLAQYGREYNVFPPDQMSM